MLSTMRTGCRSPSSPTGTLSWRRPSACSVCGCTIVFWRDGWRPGAILSPLAFLAALLAGESGIGIAPYLLGYALFLEQRSGAARLVSILPHGVIGIVWLAAYKAGGYGTSGSGFYLDPIGQPAEWFSQFLVRAPLLLLG